MRSRGNRVALFYFLKSFCMYYLYFSLYFCPITNTHSQRSPHLYIATSENSSVRVNHTGEFQALE